MRETPNNVKIEGRTLASIIPTLVSGLYYDRFDLVREYCQNSYDAILLKYRSDSKEKGRIDITIKGDSIFIHDNGTGMTRDVVLKLATLGYTTKDTPEQVGDRGIGRLSGVCAAERIHFVTKSTLEDVEHVFEIDAKGLIGAIDHETRITEEAGEILAKFSKHWAKKVNNNRTSYTTVVLYDIYGQSGKLLDETRLRQYLEWNLPVPAHPDMQHALKIEDLYERHETKFPNIQIFLNGAPVYKPFHRLGKRMKYEELKLKNAKGKIIAVAWYAWKANESNMVKDDSIRGIRFRHKGFAIGQTEMMREILGTAPPQVPDWFIGEVLVVDDKCVISSDRSRFEDNEARNDLYGALRNNLGKKVETIARERSVKKSVSKATVNAQKQTAQLGAIVGSLKHVSEDELSRRIEEAETAKWKLAQKVNGAQRDEEQKKTEQKLGRVIEKAKRKLEAEQIGVVEKCRLTESNRIVYETIISTIRDSYDQCRNVGELITKIDNKLIRKLKK